MSVQIEGLQLLNIGIHETITHPMTFDTFL
jgi:hypothetical protein